MTAQTTCERHGTQPYALICVHLAEATSLSYFLIEEEPGEPAQAWCAACDQVLEAESGWTDRADDQAYWKLFCKECFDETLERHQLESLVEGGPSPD